MGGGAVPLMDKSKFSFAFTYKESHIYGKEFLKSFSTLYISLVIYKNTV